jgi:acyl carrier protein
MQRQEIEKDVCQILSNVLEIEVKPGKVIDRDTVAEWDSLKHMELLFSIEEKFDIQFTQDELTQISSLGQIVDKLETNYITQAQ